jgi:hypothetical protein
LEEEALNIKEEEHVEENLHPDNEFRKIIF